MVNRLSALKAQLLLRVLALLMRETKALLVRLRFRALNLHQPKKPVIHLPLGLVALRVQMVVRNRLMI